MLSGTKLRCLGACLGAALSAWTFGACSSSATSPKSAGGGAAGGGGTSSEAGGGSGGSEAATSPAQKFAPLSAAPGGLAFGKDSSGQTALFVSLTSQDQVEEIDQAGAAKKLANVPAPTGIALQANGDLLVCGTGQSGDAGSTGTLWEVKPDGTITAFVTNAAFGTLSSVAIAPDDRVVIADTENNKVYRLEADGSSPAIIAATLTQPTGLAFSADGTELYMTSKGNGTLSQLDRSAAVGNYAAEPTLLAQGLINPNAIVVMQNKDLLVMTDNGLLRLGADGKNQRTVAPKSAFTAPVGAAFGVGAFGDTFLYLGDALGVARLSFQDKAVTLPVR